MSNTRRYVITTVILIIISCFGILLYTIFHDDGKITVPQLVGTSLPEASETLSGLGLSARVEKVDSQEGENTVLTQDIKPGKKVKQGTVLILQVSRGGKQIKIPDVRNMKIADAVGKLEAAGFKVTKTLKVNDTEHEPGTVLAQNPYGGQAVDTQCPVELLVTEDNVLGEGSVYVPDLRGKSVEDAEKALSKIGLIAGEKNTTDSSAPEGAVVGTKPGIGAKVDTGTAINLMISSGKEPERAKAAADNESEIKKESTVKAVKAQPKQEPKKAETKAAAKPEAKQQPAKAEAKTETKQPAKTETKTAAKETKEETKQPQKTETKTAAKETKEETKQPEKTETKAVEKKTEQPKKSEKLRYVVPPIVKPMSLKVTLQDTRGTHILKDMTVKGNEIIDLQFRYSGKANLTILLGGEEVWQEFYK